VIPLIFNRIGDTGTLNLAKNCLLFFSMVVLETIEFLFARFAPIAISNRGGQYPSRALALRLTKLVEHFFKPASIPATLFLFTLSTISLAQTIEAESGARVGTVTSTQLAGYSGTGYVTGFDNDGDKVTITVNANKGVYNLYIRYASPSGDKYNYVYVNDQNLGDAAFPLSATFKETKVGKVYLQQGSNSIAIVKNWGYFELDNIRLEASSPSPVNNVAAGLVTPISSPEASGLYDFLFGIYGKVILSGQYGGTNELNRIKNVSGKVPVVRGFDLIDYSPSRVEQGTSSTETEKAIDWSKQRGIVTFAWHWNAPKDLIDQPEKEWWRGFYTYATTFDVSEAMNDETSEEYTLLLRDIDVIAIQLKKLKDAKVAVLWRPLHEAEGAWFWWGAKGPEPCKWLWKLLFKRLVNHHELDNLIWVWTSTANASAPDWYPGDEYVDMIGADIYLPAGTYSSNFITFDNLAALYGGRKIITLSENGTIPNPESLFVEGAAWSWFATWEGGFIMDGITNSTSHVNTVFNHDYVITLDEIDFIADIIEELQLRKEEENEEDVITGLVESSSMVAIRNPIRDNRLIISVKDNMPVRQIIIYNVQGRTEFTVNDIDQQMEFNFEDKSTGMYFVKVITHDSVKVFRVVKI
jgi:mannan endo-1,4-beta-mannosidase